MRKVLFAVVAAAVATAAVPVVTRTSPVRAVPNPVATTETTYQAFGRAFPDPHGCLAFGAADRDGDGVKDTPRGVSPWAKGRVCAGEFLSYEEVVDGTRFLAGRFKGYIDVIRLDDAYKDPEMRSAGIPRMATVQDGKVVPVSRDRRPLYLFKVTDPSSAIPETEREHFAYALSIHGIERAGLEGGVRAMEDLVTWAACERPEYAATTPACTAEGPFPKKIVETPTGDAVPTAGDALRRSVVYFVLPNPDGWARGQVAPVEQREGTPNPNYTPGFFFQRYNGNGVDLNRDWPTIGYTYKPYSPSSEPETKAFARALSDARARTAAGKFAAGIDLHGMITAYAFSYTLLGAGQRDWRKNSLAVDTSVRTYKDQVKRLAWSPYVADANADGVASQSEAEVCANEPVLGGNQTRGRVPACVADQWGTVIDTIGYQITGALGDWMDSPMGLDAVGIDNEMYASHLAPNIVFDPALEQTHIDGNKGLITSQIASLLGPTDTVFEPGGRVAYVVNPKRLTRPDTGRAPNPGLPAQADVEVLLPCRGDGCNGGDFVTQGAGMAFEFDTHGPADGYWNGGLTVTVTVPNVLGAGSVPGLQLQHFDEGQWHTVATAGGTDAYAPSGAILTVNDPPADRWRVYFNTAVPGTRLRLDFDPFTAEASPGQAVVDASPQDFFAELNRYVPEGRKLEGITAASVVAEGPALDRFDTIVVTGAMGDAGYVGSLGVDGTSYLAALKGFAERGGNVVLTDAALKAAAAFGLVPASSVKRATGLVGNYNFDIGTTKLTYQDPIAYPLARGVGKPGAAEQQPGRRQAVEPTPLGYSPDLGDDPDPAMPFWGIDRPRWVSACGVPDCVTALTSPKGTPTNNVNLGEAVVGAGRVRIAGILLPDPVLDADDANDHRFGVADYALTYTSYEVFRNLVDYRRP